MKKTLLILLIVLTACGGSAMAQAASTSGNQQTIKLGHINSIELMQIMPGRDSVQAILKAEATELQNTFNSMATELETRYNEYISKQDAMSDLIKQTKQRELQDMQARAEEFQKNAQQQLSDRETELFKPLADRARNAIKEVAEENGYTYVFDSGVGTLLYSQDSDDLMPLVKKKLGL